MGEVIPVLFITIALMTGTAGLLEAVRRRKGLNPIPAW